MRTRRLKVHGRPAVYHCMTRTVNGEPLFKDREKEVLRKMLWQVADFCGVEVLTYCVMSNHFHVLVRVPDLIRITDGELMRRYRVLYPKPTKYQAESAKVMERQLQEGGKEADAIRIRLQARMGDVSEFMKAVKQRFSVWYNRTHERYGTLWSERFKSVLVEGRGNPLQTMAAYIDLNPVRAGLVDDPKDYRFCGYAEAVAGSGGARKGLSRIWSDRVAGIPEALRSHRALIFGKGSAPAEGKQSIDRKKALKVLEKEGAVLPKAAILRCRVRYFSDGAILGSKAFVKGYVDAWQMERGRQRPPKPCDLQGADWGDLAVIRGLRRQIFG
ncbi:transposase [Coraliomargarita parva]|uniref:transposase n=1 Tax=Coraliomargarita parva TaxID=3014050 RepID=UPI0022B55244|nr:transposase [Coraliomargarita parva]